LPFRERLAPVLDKIKLAGFYRHDRMRAEIFQLAQNPRGSGRDKPLNQVLACKPGRSHPQAAASIDCEPQTPRPPAYEQGILVFFSANAIYFFIT